MKVLSFFHVRPIVRYAKTWVFKKKKNFFQKAVKHDKIWYKLSS